MSDLIWLSRRKQKSEISIRCLSVVMETALPPQHTYIMLNAQIQNMILI